MGRTRQGQDECSVKVARTTGGSKQKKREEMKMCVIIDYEVISPDVLEYLITSIVDCLCIWTDLGEDSFEFTVTLCEDYSKAEKVLARYV